MPVGALLAGITTDLFGLAAAVWLVGGLTLLSGVIVALRMNEGSEPRSRSWCPSKSANR